MAIIPKELAEKTFDESIPRPDISGVSIKDDMQVRAGFDVLPEGSDVLYIPFSEWPQEAKDFMLARAEAKVKKDHPQP